MSVLYECNERRRRSGPKNEGRADQRIERNEYGKATGLERDTGEEVEWYIYKKCDTPISPSDPQASKTISGVCPLEQVYEQSEYLIGV